VTYATTIADIAKNADAAGFTRSPFVAVVAVFQA
jgi:hypothetical protein